MRDLAVRCLCPFPCCRLPRRASGSVIPTAQAHRRSIRSLDHPSIGRAICAVFVGAQTPLSTSFQRISDDLRRATGKRPQSGSLQTALPDPGKTGVSATIAPARIARRSSMDFWGVRRQAVTNAEQMRTIGGTRAISNEQTGYLWAAAFHDRPGCWSAGPGAGRPRKSRTRPACRRCARQKCRRMIPPWWSSRWPSCASG